MKQTRENLGFEPGKREGGWGKKAFERLSIALLVMIIASVVRMVAEIFFVFGL